MKLRVDLGMPCLWSLPRPSNFPAGNIQQLGPDVVKALFHAGFDGAQLYRLQDVAPLRKSAIGIAKLPSQVAEIACLHQDGGCDVTTLVVGSGLEDDAGIDRLFEAVVDAADRLSYPLLVETHRGSATQDIRRMLDALARHPDILVTADFGHWYVGLEMRFGDFDERVDALGPLFDRVRSIHGRIGDSGSFQRPLGAAGMEQPIADMERLWRLAIRGFLKNAGEGDELLFATQLFPPQMEIDGRTHWFFGSHADERGVEMGDRWADVLALTAMARRLFAEESAELGDARHATA